MPHPPLIFRSADQRHRSQSLISRRLEMKALRGVAYRADNGVTDRKSPCRMRIPIAATPRKTSVHSIGDDDERC